MIYLDNAATTCVIPEVRGIYDRLSSFSWGNANSQHSFGKTSKNHLDEATIIISDIIHCDPNNLIFTSGATEGNNMIVNTLNKNYLDDNGFVITSKMEHDSIFNTLKYNCKRTCLYVKPNKHGIIEPNDVDKLIKLGNVQFVSIQMVNNEIGIIQRIKEIATICHKYNILFHTDATQAMGHMNVDVKNLDVDFLTASGHKFNGPKGVGFIYAKDINRLHPLINGGHQQNNKRAGTIDVPGIYSMAIALQINSKRIKENSIKCNEMRKYIVDKLKKHERFHINGSMNELERMTNNLNFYIDGIDSEYILDILDKHKIYASTGSACSLGYNEFSNTLLSMGKTKWIAKNSIRFTFDPSINSITDMPEVVNVLESIINNFL